MSHRVLVSVGGVAVLVAFVSLAAPPVAAQTAEPTTAGGDIYWRADGSLGAYNNLWLDQGISIVGTRSTSLVIDPPNGRLPALTANGQRRAEARRRYVQQGAPRRFMVGPRRCRSLPAGAQLRSPDHAGRLQPKPVAVSDP